MYLHVIMTHTFNWLIIHTSNIVYTYMNSQILVVCINNKYVYISNEFLKALHKCDVDLCTYK